MTEAALAELMLADARACNARLRKITGNHPSPEELAKIKARGALGGHLSHANGSKVGKNGPRKAAQ